MNGRRKIILAFGASAILSPLATLAQQAGKVARVGFLYFGSRQSALDSGRYTAFMQSASELGHASGTNLVIEERYADGKSDRLPALVAQLISAKVEVIVATGGQVYRALQNAATTVPTIITVTTDPIANGYAASMAHPGGNFTGFTVTAADMGSKYLELLNTVVPKLSRVGVLLHPDNVTHPALYTHIVSTAQKSGKQVLLAQAGTMEGIAGEFAMLARERVNAVIILNDTYFVERLREIAAQALKYRLPSIYSIRAFAEAGGLLSYGPNIVDNFRRAAVYMDKILKGAKPGDLPFEQPTRYYLYINRKTVAALGLKIPKELLLRADKVIE